MTAGLSGYLSAGAGFPPFDVCQPAAKVVSQHNVEWRVTQHVFRASITRHSTLLAHTRKAWYNDGEEYGYWQIKLDPKTGALDLEGLRRREFTEF